MHTHTHYCVKIIPTDAEMCTSWKSSCSITASRKSTTLGKTDEWAYSCEVSAPVDLGLLVTWTSAQHLSVPSKRRDCHPRSSQLMGETSPLTNIFPRYEHQSGFVQIHRKRFSNNAHWASPVVVGRRWPIGRGRGVWTCRSRVRILPPSANPQLAAFCWPQTPSRKLMYIVISLLMEAKIKRYLTARVYPHS